MFVHMLVRIINSTKRVVSISVNFNSQTFECVVTSKGIGQNLVELLCVVL